MKYFFFLCLFFSAQALASSVTVVDDLGNKVTLSAPARRVIALAPNATELAVAAGAGKALVAVSAFSDYPPWVKRLPQTGKGIRLNEESLERWQPDLLIAPAFSSPLISKRLRGKTSVYIADAPTPERIADDIENIGALTGHSRGARSVAEAFREQLAALKAGAKQRARRPKVLYVLWNDPVFAAGGDSLIDRAIEGCGGDNIFKDERRGAFIASIEAIIGANPDVILIGADEKSFAAWKKDWMKWTAIQAVRKQAIDRVEPDYAHRAGPRFIEGMRQICEAIRGASRDGIQMIFTTNNTNLHE